MIKVNDIYSIIKGKEEPLSSDVIVIDNNIIFDVGNGDYIVDELNTIKDKIVVISHFHKDHIENLNKIDCSQLYIGDNTYKYTNKGTIVDKDIYIRKARLFKISSCHAKGSVGLQIGDYAFIGDATSPQFKGNKWVYNVQLLKQEIEELSKINVKYFVFSHKADKPEPKENVINRLTEIYNLRSKDNSYIETYIVS